MAEDNLRETQRSVASLERNHDRSPAGPAIQASAARMLREILERLGALARPDRAPLSALTVELFDPHRAARIRSPPISARRGCCGAPRWCPCQPAAPDDRTA